MIWVSGSETSIMDSFMTVIGIWSQPAALNSNFSDLVLGCRVEEYIDCVQEPLRKLRSEAVDCIPLAKLGPML